MRGAIAERYLLASVSLEKLPGTQEYRISCEKARIAVMKYVLLDILGCLKISGV
jgi:hypothetical protein